MTNKINTTDISTSLGTFDYFFGASSFEERCLAIARNFRQSQIERGGFIFETEEVHAGWQKNTHELAKYVGSATEIVRLDTTNPLNTLASFREVVDKVAVNGPSSLLIDITTFTHESLLILLFAIDPLVQSEVSITLIYSAAEKYPEWLSFGIREIRSVVGYPGLLLPSRPLHFVVLMGYEEERAKQLIESYEPALISIGRSSPGVNAENEKRNADYVERLSSPRSNVRQFTFDAKDPDATANSIESAINDAGKDFNVVIAPLNTKLSTVGAAMTAAKNPKIQICYALPILYNTSEYSSGIEAVYYTRYNTLHNIE